MRERVLCMRYEGYEGNKGYLGYEGNKGYLGYEGEGGL